MFTTEAGCTAEEQATQRGLAYRQLYTCVEVLKDSLADSIIATAVTEWSYWSYDATRLQLVMEVFSDAECHVFSRNATLAVASTGKSLMCDNVRLPWSCEANSPNCLVEYGGCITHGVSGCVDASRPERWRLVGCDLTTSTLPKAVYDDYFSSSDCSGSPSLRISYGTSVATSCERIASQPDTKALMVTQCGTGTDAFKSALYNVDATKTAAELTPTTCGAETSAPIVITPGACVETTPATALFGRHYYHRVACLQDTTAPSMAPTVAPTSAPTSPTMAPTATPTDMPTFAPTNYTAPPPPLSAFDQAIEDVGLVNLIGVGIGIGVLCCVLIVGTVTVFALLYAFVWKKRGMPCCLRCLDKEYSSSSTTTKAHMEERKKQFELNKMKKQKNAVTNSAGSSDGGGFGLKKTDSAKKVKAMANPMRGLATKKKAKAKGEAKEGGAGVSYLKMLEGSNAEGGGDLAIPAGWTAHPDPGSGKQYFHHAESGETSWIHPAHADKLPANWTPVDDGSGKIYFHNSVTNATSWEKPQAVDAGI